MVVGWQVLPAAGVPVRALLQDERFLVGTAALLAALLVGAAVIAFTKRWRQRQEPALPTTGDQLSYFRVLYERGELNQEEFEQIRARLAQQLKEQLAAPTAPSAPSEPKNGPDPAS